MRHNYFLVFLITSMLSLTMAAQEDPFPWPEDELGEAFLIQPGDPGTINATISGDTMPDGSRRHNIYLLRRGATYLYTARINNVGYPLMVMAEDGDGPLPLIKALGPPPGEDEAPRAFHAQGNLYLKDLHINGRDQTDSPTDNATVRLAADGVTVVLRGVLFEFNRQNAVRINGSDCRVFMEHCVMGPQGNAFNIMNGFALNYRGNFAPEVHIRNSSFYSLSRGLISNQGSQRHGKLTIEHCTVVNTGVDGAQFGRPDTLIFRDNLLVNTGILGDGFDGDRDNFAEPYFAYYLDSNNVVTDTVFTGGDTIVNFENVQPEVTFERNYFYNDPIIAENLPDSSTNYFTDDAELLIDEELSDDMDMNSNVIAEEEFDFDNFTMEDQEFVDFIEDFYQFEDLQQEIPGFENDITQIDLGYSDDRPAASGARGGQPVGDLTWWGLEIISSQYTVEALDIAIYPNPVSNVLRVDLEDVRSVMLYDLQGRLVRHFGSLHGNTVSLDLSNVQTGIYTILAINGDRQAVTRRIVKN